MSCTRADIREAAVDQAWAAIKSADRYVDIYRAEPHSVMVHYTRDGMVINAYLLLDAPDARQQLPPRVLAEVHKFDANKHRRIRAWLYDHKKRATA